ncbi:isoamyl acetate-hydrolyzing esterase [Coemansia sp. RSA 1972]|nr:isoamyl acetate-hydrolyzing esterase [Coemansia sp. RSA 1972]
MNFVWPALVLLVTVCAAQSESKSTMYNMYDVMIAFGDSNTQLGHNPKNNGYVARLAHVYQRQMDVLNRGFSGFNASSGRSIATSVLPKTAKQSARSLWPSRDLFPGTTRTLQLLIVGFGTNDAGLPFTGKGNPLDKYTDDLTYIIKMVKDVGSEYYQKSARVLVVTPPPIGDKLLQKISDEKHEQRGWYNNRTQTYAQAAIRVANNEKVPVVDVYSEIERLVASDQNGAYGGYDKYFIDGMHYTAKGYDVLYNLVQAKINSEWPELVPTDIFTPQPPK